MGGEASLSQTRKIMSILPPSSWLIGPWDVTLLHLIYQSLLRVTFSPRPCLGLFLYLLPLNIAMYSYVLQLALLCFAFKPMPFLSLTPPHPCLSPPLAPVKPLYPLFQPLPICSCLKPVSHPVHPLSLSVSITFALPLYNFCPA